MLRKSTIGKELFEKYSVIFYDSNYNKMYPTISNDCYNTLFYSSLLIDFTR